MLSIELKRRSDAEDPDELEIYCDEEGLDSLLAQLQLVKTGRTEHVHLMAFSWGGSHLDDSPQDPSHLSIRHAKLILLRRRGTP